MAKAKAKVKEHDESVEGNEATEAKATRKIMLTVDGEEISRVDFIRREWEAGKSRGAIAKELTKLQGKAVPYQIVFAATKGLAGGPKKEVAEESAED